MKIFPQCCIELKGYYASLDYRRALPVVCVTALLLLSYTFRQCRYAPSYPRSFLNQTSNSLAQLPQPLTKLIVVSHYDENLNWLDIFIGDRIPHIVYTRSSDSLARYGLPVNKGREAVAYLRYIVDHYSDLPSLIAFIHGHRTAWHQTDPSDIVVALRALRWNRYNFMPLTSTMTFGFFQEKGPDLQSAVNFQLWRDVLQKELGPAPITGVKGHCCATFVVRREAILKHPKQFYSNIIDYIMNSKHSDQLTGRTLEYTWHVIFGERAIVHFKPCDLFFCDAKGAISVAEAEKHQ